MLPAFHPGDSVLVCTFLKHPKPGDIVVVKDFENREILKRVQSVRNENYFLVGDNGGKSIDSRRFGPISKKQVVGKVIYTLKQ